MKATPIQSYFFFGTCVRFLQDTPGSGASLADGEAGWGIRTNVKQLTEYVQDLGLDVTSRHSEYGRLVAMLDEISEVEVTVLTALQAQRLKTSVSELRGTIEAELRGLTAYTVTPKRYDTGRLLRNVASVLAPGSYDRLPAIAQFDLRESGKCLAFELPTASAFHLLRATEAALRAFHIVLVRRCANRPQMWGPIIQDLRTRERAKKHTVLLDNLDNIRRSFRNPTQHPDATYAMHETEDLWGLCIDVLNRMSVELPLASPAA